MDINVALWKMRELAEIVLGADGHASPIEIEMAECWQSIDDHMSKGGFAPKPWQTDGNHISGTVTGTVVQARDINGGLNL